ncbi:MAG: terminase large subunit domain-containing protein, partial [bacterium]
MHIDPDLLAVATDAELAAYETALMSEAALASPADYGEALAKEGVHLGTPFERPAHVDLISETLTALIEGRLLKPNGRPFRKLMVALPPRHGKSELISRYAPAWYLTKYPERKVMVVGYSDEFAAGFGRDARTLVEQAPEWLTTPLRQDTKAAHRWLTEANGAMFTAGIGGPLTGRGGHYIVIDDPIKSSAEAQSETVRQAHWDWVQSTVMTRREPGAVVVLVATRWHESDLTGKFLEWEGDDWYQLVLPAIAGEDDPLGRAPGEALWESRIPLDELEEIRDGGDESMYWWSAMYQQSPSVEGGGI